MSLFDESSSILETSAPIIIEHEIEYVVHKAESRNREKVLEAIKELFPEEDPEFYYGPLEQLDKWTHDSHIFYLNSGMYPIIARLMDLIGEPATLYLYPEEKLYLSKITRALLHGQILRSKEECLSFKDPGKDWIEITGKPEEIMKNFEVNFK